MAYPTFTTARTSSSSDTTTVNYDIPTGIAAGKLLILLLLMDSGSDSPLTDPTGFTQFASLSIGGGGGAGGFGYYKFTDGTEVNSTFTLSGAQEYVCYTILVSGAHASTPPESTVTNSSGTSADPPSETASWGADDNLFFTWVGTSNNVNPATWGPPSGYTEIYNNTTGADVDSVQANLSYKTISAATENPGTEPLGASVNWGATTIVVRPATAGIPALPDLIPGPSNPEFTTYSPRRRFSTGRGGTFMEYFDPLVPADEPVTADKFWPVYETVMRKHQRRPEGWFAYTEVPVPADVVDHGWEFAMPQIQRRWRDRSARLYGSFLVPQVQDPLTTTYLTILGTTTLRPTYYGRNVIEPTYEGECDFNLEGE